MKNIEVIEELPNGFLKTECGVLLSPQQFELMQTISPSTLFVVVVDADLQKLRTEEIEK